MFYKAKLEDHIRVSPELFDEDPSEAILDQAREDYRGYISEDLGFVVDVIETDNVGEGVIVPGDGAAYYKTKFQVLLYRPEMHEIVLGKIEDIAEFGAFMTLGPAEGMIHVSQTMDDYVSFSKDKVLSGKESNKTLKVGDKCRASVVAISYKDLSNPKIGLTMRQDGLGRLDWLNENNEENNEENEEDDGESE